MIVASIDIGTNTVLLLLAEVDKTTGGLKTIKNLYNMPRIGKGVIKGGNISEEKIALLLDILRDYKAEAEKYNAGKIILTATNAFRIAANGKEIVKKVKDELGLDVKIIPGDEEAKYSYLGASSAAKSGRKKLVIDIGGGSTEIIIGEEENIIFKKSFQIGVVTLTEKFVDQNPPSQQNINEMYDFILETFVELKDFSKDNVSAVAVAGTPTTLSCIKQNLKDYVDEKVEGSILSKDDLQNLADEIAARTHEQIKNNYGSVVAGREDVLLSGTLILKSLADILNLEEMIVSSKGLRYGAVINFLNS
jgi:exopolyphosphatase / guanosine-5'-triphosphate,3'-diphosphate pyrophosphatase